MIEKMMTEQDGKLLVEAPYYPPANASYKAAGGRWNGGAWVFDARDKARVAEILKRHFGTGKPVTIRAYIQSSDEALWAFGRLIALRKTRDAAVRLGDGVVIVEGEFPSSSGSRRYPSINRHGKPVLLEIRDVPESLIDPDDPPYGLSSLEIVAEKKDYNPLADFSDEELVAELVRRGYKIA